MNFGISEHHTGLIIDTLKSNGVTRAVVFGSRAKGNFRDNSDVDICVWGDVNVRKILACLDELPTPYKFDLIEYKTIKNKPLQEHIDRVGKTLLLQKGEL
ncbi:MAG: nucleotidyltransferase domain-containing protein [Victivallales bacterium]|jgi:predicted nucleotidyltransferase|nr:nucleotidyltransferase domain-containing protein [Victivallales bacterium]